MYLSTPTLFGRIFGYNYDEANYVQNFHWITSIRYNKKYELLQPLPVQVKILEKLTVSHFSYETGFSSHCRNALIKAIIIC